LDLQGLGDTHTSLRALRTWAAVDDTGRCTTMQKKVTNSQVLQVPTEVVEGWLPRPDSRALRAEHAGTPTL
jgi:hypothetical protein